MTSEWKEMNLKNVLVDKGYIRGPFGSALKRNEMQIEGIPVYEQQNAIYNHRLFRFFIDAEKFESMKRFQVQTNDLIVSCSGTVGKVSIIKDKDAKGIISQALLILRADSNVISPYFLKYFFQSDYGYNSIVSRSSGSVQVNIAKREVIENITINLPSIELQKKIVSILSSIDDKIAINTEINENLEQQAQTIFKSWFVDFEPFDEEMAVSPIGSLVPKSLKMVQIADIPHELETGKRPKGGAVAIGVPSVGAENVKKLGEFNPASAKYIPFEFASKLKSGAIKGYELLLYKDGGKPGTFIQHFSMFGEGFPYPNFFINEHVFKLDFHNRGFNEFMYFYLQTDYPYHWLSTNGGKAAVPGINQQDVKAIWCYAPKHPKVQEFCQWIEPIFTTILSNCAQNMKLATLRDTLLPKLMNGEIDVSKVQI